MNNFSFVKKGLQLGISILAYCLKKCSLNQLFMYNNTIYLNFVYHFWYLYNGY